MDQKIVLDKIKRGDILYPDYNNFYLKTLNQKSDDFFYTENGNLVLAFKIKYENENQWFLIGKFILFEDSFKIDDLHYTILEDESYEHFKAENQTVSFMDF